MTGAVLGRTVLPEGRFGDYVVSGPEDSVGVVGPPRYGKTGGVIIPTLLRWPGPLVCTSTRGDVLAFAGARRRELGAVHVYDPFRSEPGVEPMRWSPIAGCEDPSVCYRRVAAMTAAAGSGIQDGEYWRAGAARILRACFHAAALIEAPLSVARRWIAAREAGDAIAIIRMCSERARLWADDLDGMSALGERERGSFYQVAMSTLEATADPTVLASCDATDLDLDRFLAAPSSLFVIGPSHHQQALAPLIAGLVDAVAQRAAELAAQQGGRLSPPLLLALDEVANIAPLRSLPALVSEGGGRGIVTLWAVQSLAQLRMRYGTEEQRAILAATSAKLIYGGLSDGHDLQEVSSWAGEVEAVGPAAGGWIQDPAPGPAGAARASRSWRPALPVGELQRLQPLNAYLFWRGSPPMLLQTPHAASVPEWRKLAAAGQGR